jgi:uncharacterized membrane protein YqgA involved in biofilm formation
MIGTILNAAGIFAGGVVGLATARQLSAAHKHALKVILGVLVVYAGLSTTWKALNGSFLQMLKQLLIVLLALMLGNLVGKLLRVQKSLNGLGQYAKNKFAKTSPGSPNRLSEGFVTCSILYCVGPMAVLGSLQDGLQGDFRTLAIKAAMDGLATVAFAKVFGWGVLLSVLPVVAYQGTLTLLAQFLRPVVQDPALLQALNATLGLLVFSISLIILELKRIALADYLPSLVLAPLITWWWR